MDIKMVPVYEQCEEISKLFSEYTNMLIENDEAFKKYLALQNYDEELCHIEAKYGMPDGRLYLLYYNGKAAGCIGLRKLDNKHCEMKRLYVRPEFNGKGLGNILVKKIIEDAKEIGYSYMLLDTLPFLQSAIHMYKKFGFYEIERYNNSPMDSTVYMKLDLKNQIS